MITPLAVLEEWFQPLLVQMRGMSWLERLRQLYSLDTLDTRLTTSSTVPTREAAINDFGQRRSTAKQNIRPNGRANGSAAGDTPRQLPPDANPSKWNTPEYYFYYLVFLTAIPLMFWVPYNLSKASDPQYPKFAPLLSEGWIPGRKVDNSDNQYASFRDNIPAMAAVLVLHQLFRGVSTVLYYRRQGPDLWKKGPSPDERLDMRVGYDVTFATIFLCVLHGFSALKVLLILYANFMLVTKLPRKYVPPATWVFCIALLFANELCSGYPYERIARVFSLTSGPNREPLANWGAWLDSYGGLIPRWEVLFKVCILRLISFNLDHYWSLGYRGSSPIEKQLDVVDFSERDRVAIPAEPRYFTFRNYFAYVLYSPLYLAGPIVTFNEFIRQVQYMPGSVNIRRNTLYGIRFLLALLSMELLLHFMYVVAISKSDPDWAAYTPLQLSMLGYFNLHIIWLKLLLPWRFFRLWALCDGLDPPENMVRCMSDNYSATAFWRGWHRSFNRWIVRYIYVPLGGGAGREEAGSRPPWLEKLRPVITMLAVFTFVALWHDISLTLLTWSWLIVLFLLPEMVARSLFPASKYKDRPEFYRFISGVGAVGNILMMMVANLVGFAVGVDGVVGLVKGIVAGWWGWTFLLVACATLYVGAQVMFEIREEERRQGINLKF